MDEFDTIVAATAKEAGLGIMAEVITVLADREVIPEKVLADLDADDLTDYYNSFIGPAIDAIQYDIAATRGLSNDPDSTAEEAP